MFRLLLVLLLLLAPTLSQAEVLPRPQLLLLYVERVPSDVTAQRIGQLLDLIPNGPAKNAAKATLRQDLENSIANRRQAITQRFIDTLDSNATDVDDSDF